MRRSRCKHCNTLVKPGEDCWKCRFQEADNKEIAFYNDPAKTFIYGGTQLPNGRKLVRCYHGANGGVWSIDDHGSHWAGVSDMIEVK